MNKVYLLIVLLALASMDTKDVNIVEHNKISNGYQIFSADTKEHNSCAIGYQAIYLNGKKHNNFTVGYDKEVK